MQVMLQKKSKRNLKIVNASFWASCHSVCSPWWGRPNGFWYWLLQRDQLSWPMRTGLWQHNYRQSCFTATICLCKATSHPAFGNRRREEGRVATWGWVCRCLNPPGPKVLSCPRLWGLSMGCWELELGPDLAQLEEAGDQSSVGADRSKVNSRGQWAGR